MKVKTRKPVAEYKQRLQHANAHNGYQYTYSNILYLYSKIHINLLKK